MSRWGNRPGTASAGTRRRWNTYGDWLFQKIRIIANMKFNFAKILLDISRMR